MNRGIRRGARFVVRAWFAASMVFLVACQQGGAPPATVGEESEEGLSLDPRLPRYVSAESLEGEIVAIGSDTLENLLAHWARTFEGLYPDVSIRVEGRGSRTAPPALTSGESSLAPMSRRMTDDEVAAFAAERGHAPTRISVATDALAVYVHSDNPIDRLTFEQIDAIFSSTLECGAPEALETWGEIGVEGEWAAMPIRAYSRDELSGTYDYFRENALCDGEYAEDVVPLQSSAAVIQKIGEDRSGVGYSGIGYKSPSVDTLALARKTGEFFYDSDTSRVQASAYPLLRSLYLYVDKAPDRTLDPLVLEFIEFCLSAEGQQIVLKEGFLPLGADPARRELSKLSR